MPDGGSGLSHLTSLVQAVKCKKFMHIVLHVILIFFFEAA